MEPPAAGRSPDVEGDGGPPPKRRALLSPHRRPAFDPGLLASPFYRGPTRYGGAGACDADPKRLRFAVAERRLDVRPRSAPPGAPPLSETSKRIGALLAQFSSPLSDAKRAPPARAAIAATTVAAAGACDAPRRLRELRVPSMAALLKLKRNNRTVGSAQAAIAASLSSSSPYDPADYSLRSDASPDSFATKITAKRRAPDEPPKPVRLPDAKLDAPATLRFEPAAEPLEKRFRFRDPVDAFASRAPTLDAIYESKRANPVALWNGASHAHDEPPERPKPKSKPSEPANDRFAAILEEQKSKWECGACMLKNESARTTCASCETPKPGAAPALAPVPAPAPTLDDEKRTKPIPAPSGFSALLQKQKTQWECAACMLMNDSNRSKCACCETAKPGAEPSKPAVAFSFDATPKIAFKFGIDEAESKPKPTFEPPKPTFEASKPSADPPKFSFGIPAVIAAEPKPDTNGIGSVANGTIVAPTLCVPSSNDTVPVVPISNSKPFESDAKKPEQAKVCDPPSAVLDRNVNFTFSQSKFVPKPIVNDKHESTSKPISLSKSPDTSRETANAAPDTGRSPPMTSSSSIVAPVSQSMFTFGASPSTERAPFSGSSTFSFNSTPPVISSSAASFKSTGLFTFGTKNSVPVVPDAKPSFTTVPKVSFAEDKLNQSPFPTPSSVTPQKVTVPNESAVSDVIQFRSPVSEKPDAPATSKPIFSFTSPVTGSIASGTSSNITNSSATTPAIFAFGATPTTKSDTTNAPMFGTQVSSSPVFGTQSSDLNKTSISSSIFKMNPTPTTTFSSMTGSIFGSKGAISANLFSIPNQSVENKPSLPVFGSQITNISSPSSAPTGSIFSNQSTSVASFNSGNIFGSPGQLSNNNNNNVQPTNLFSTQTPNKQSNTPETGSGMFGTKSPQSGAFFNPNLPTGTPLSTGGIFGSHPAVPTPVFGASIPFGEATQTQSAQNTPFKFGAPNPSQSTAMPFGQAPAAGSSAPLFSFGSSAVAPAPSQFNFSMGAPSGFSNTGANAGQPARRYKKAVRRNAPRI